MNHGILCVIFAVLAELAIFGAAISWNRSRYAEPVRSDDRDSIERARVLHISRGTDKRSA